jgi:hypothetical protein
MEKTLIIGLGTGRCGTTSLSDFLSAQPEMKVIHEGRIDDLRHLIKWEGDRENLLQWLDTLEKKCESQKYFGDVGRYFLPYVPLLISRFPNSKFICIKRDRQEVIKSFLHKTQGRNHWYDHDGKIWKKDLIWDDTFPKFEQPDKAKAIGMFWDMYHEEIDRLIAQYPQNICCFSIKSLNETKGRQKILNFIEYQGERNIAGEYKANGYSLLFDRYLHTFFGSADRYCQNRFVIGCG